MSLCDLRGKAIRSKQKFYDKAGAINLTVKVAFSIDTVIYPQLIVRTGKKQIFALPYALFKHCSFSTASGYDALTANKQYSSFFAVS